MNVVRPMRPARGLKVVAGGGGLSARGVGKTYKGRPVVRNVTVTLHRGEAVGLLGPNGAGKTTTFYMIVGLVTARYRVDQPRRRGHHQTADVPPRPSGDRLPAAGSQRVPRPERRAERHGRARGHRTRCRHPRHDAGRVAGANSASAIFAAPRRWRCPAASAGASRSPARWRRSRPTSCWTSRWPASTRSPWAKSAIWSST